MEMVKEGKEARLKIAENIVVRFNDRSRSWMAVCAGSAADSIRHHRHAVLSSESCSRLIAAKAGASLRETLSGGGYDESDRNGMDVIREAGRSSTTTTSRPKSGASIRHPRHVVDAAMIGADVATLPPKC
jgi:transaldolase